MQLQAVKARCNSASREGVEPHFDPAYLYEVLREAATAKVSGYSGAVPRNRRAQVESS